MASTVMRAAEQAQDPSPPRTWIPVVASSSTVKEIPQKLHEKLPPAQLTVIASTSTIEEVQEIQPAPLPIITPITSIEELEEMLEQQEIQLAPLPIIASSWTVKEVEEMPEKQSIKQKTTLVPTSTNTASETLHMETDDQLVAPDLKGDDPDMEISAEQLEGGEGLEPEDDSLRQNEVKLSTSKELLMTDCFLVRGRKRRVMKKTTGATRKM